MLTHNRISLKTKIIDKMIRYWIHYKDFPSPITIQDVLELSKQ